MSVRRVEDITEALWGTRVSPSTVSDLNKKIYATIEDWRNPPIEGEHPWCSWRKITSGLGAVESPPFANAAAPGPVPGAAKSNPCVTLPQQSVQ